MSVFDTLSEIDILKYEGKERIEYTLDFAIKCLDVRSIEHGNIVVKELVKEYLA